MCRKLTGEEEYGMNLSEWVGEDTVGRDLGGEAERRMRRGERCLGDGVLCRVAEVVEVLGAGKSGYGVGLNLAKSR